MILAGTIAIDMLNRGDMTPGNHVSSRSQGGCNLVSFLGARSPALQQDCSYAVMSQSGSFNQLLVVDFVFPA